MFYKVKPYCSYSAGRMSGNDTILHVSAVNMNREALRIEQEHDPRSRPRPLKQSSFLALIWRMIFYRPVWSSENQHQRNVRFIYVDFSAWHFAGSDLLWAGIAIRLFQAMQLNFGKLQLALFRVAQYDEEDEVKREVRHLLDSVYPL